MPKRSQYSYDKEGNFTVFKEYKGGVQAGIGNGAFYNDLVNFENEALNALIQGYSTAPYFFTSPLTTKGDIHVFDTVDSRLAVGSNYKALLADSSTASGLAWTSLNTTKGDLLAHNGTLPIRHAVGSFAQTLVPDAAQTNGLAWVNWFSPFLKHYWLQVNQDAGTTFTATGGAPTATVAGGTPTAAEDATGQYVNYASAASGSSNYGIYSSTNFCKFRQLPRWFFAFKTGPDAADIQDVRLWIGLVTFASMPVVASDTPTSNYAMFRFSTNVPDTNWQCVTCDNSSRTITDSGVAVAADTRYEFAILVESSSCSFYINGTRVAVNTTTLPTSTAATGFQCVGRELAAAAKEIRPANAEIHYL